MSLRIDIRHRQGDFALEATLTTSARVTALYGPSGAGKTSVIRAVAGLLRPDQGRIALGEDVLFDGQAGIFVPPHRRRIGYVFQDARLFPHLTVRQNLSYGRWFAPKGGQDFEAVVGLLGIEPLLSRMPVHLSGGEAQRVSIGRALLSNPRLLLLDEPLAALDPARKAEILPYLERLCEGSRIPILYVSHSMREISAFADHLVMLEAGRVRSAGPLQAVLQDPRQAKRLPPSEQGSTLRAVVRAEVAGLTELATLAGPVWIAATALSQGASVRLRIAPEDVMIATEAPKGLSALNILPARIAAIHAAAAEPDVYLQLDLGGETILARVTARSVAALGLEVGREVHAVLKAVAMALD